MADLEFANSANDGKSLLSVERRRGRQSQTADELSRTHAPWQCSTFIHGAFKGTLILIFFSWHALKLFRVLTLC